MTRIGVAAKLQQKSSQKPTSVGRQNRMIVTDSSDIIGLHAFKLASVLPDALVLI
jgi:hypothetical protein